MSLSLFADKDFSWFHSFSYREIVIHSDLIRLDNECVIVPLLRLIASEIPSSIESCDSESCLLCISCISFLLFSKTFFLVQLLFPVPLQLSKTSFLPIHILYSMRDWGPLVVLVWLAPGLLFLLAMPSMILVMSNLVISGVLCSVSSFYVSNSRNIPIVQQFLVQVFLAHESLPPADT